MAEPGTKNKPKLRARGACRRRGPPETPTALGPPGEGRTFEARKTREVSSAKRPAHRETGSFPGISPTVCSSSFFSETHVDWKMADFLWFRMELAGARDAENKNWNDPYKPSNWWWDQNLGSFPHPLLSTSKSRSAKNHPNRVDSSRSY